MHPVELYIRMLMEKTYLRPECLRVNRGSAISLTGDRDYRKFHVDRGGCALSLNHPRMRYTVDRVDWDLR
ncbi:MAG: hypothetical protein WC072_06835, partial [Methanoregulaceae archaeon]